ncbi:MAG: DUF2281 domain-containing protein [Candidatus Muproteobacteria bacterium RBG_16_65_34]|uniref:DUF2281 domain-containing protein n=1 Tax=Candidatus Muproteobacteria bacterium RBG_16_65_34 TaxID=1817760 RepID=A0A1F6TTG8_9PROT|nr:MAG: DUF2281 domain-containing protein [Candidatus Muproteobacteria bacterium RBG_16_65_34]
MDKKLLINEIEKIPEPFIEEIYDFVSYLKARIIREKSETAIASESSLGKDWLDAREDSAWQNL